MNLDVHPDGNYQVKNITLTLTLTFAYSTLPSTTFFLVGWSTFPIRRLLQWQSSTTLLLSLVALTCQRSLNVLGQMAKATDSSLRFFFLVLFFSLPSLYQCFLLRRPITSFQQKSRTGCKSDGAWQKQAEWGLWWSHRAHGTHTHPQFDKPVPLSLSLSLSDFERESAPGAPPCGHSWVPQGLWLPPKIHTSVSQFKDPTGHSIPQ